MGENDLNDSIYCCLGLDILITAAMSPRQPPHPIITINVAPSDVTVTTIYFVGFCASIVFYSDCASESWTGPPSYISEMSTTRSRGKYLSDRNG
jgi:hypothetical protein